MRKKFLSWLLLLCITCNTMLVSISVYAQKNSIVDAYSNALLQHGTDTMSWKTSTGEMKTITTYSKYAIYDIDKDNSHELLVDDANDNMLYVYTFKNSQITCWSGYVDSYGTDNGYYEYPNGNGVIVYGGGMGSDHFEYVSKYILENEEISFNEELVNGYTLDGTVEQLRESLNSYKKIIFKKTNDLSLLDNLKEIKVVLNGEEIEFDQPPIMAEGNRILVPIRKIAEAMGDEVLWNQDTQSAFIKHGEKALIIKLLEDNIKIVKNEQWKQWQEKQLDVPAMVLNGRTLVPVRAFCESLGADVKWVGEENAAYITYDFGNKTKEMDGETFRNINAVYYALNNKATQFDTYSNDMNEFYDQRNHKLDGVAIGLSNIWGGVEDLLSGISNGERGMKDAIGQMLTNIPDNDIMVLELDSLNTSKDLLDLSKNLIDMDVEETPISGVQTALGHKIGDLLDLYDILSFTSEQIAVVNSNYTMNLDYLETFKKCLTKSNMLNENLEVAITSLELDYTSNVVQIIENGGNKLIQEAISKGGEILAGTTFSMGMLTWDIIVAGTGIGAKGDNLRSFYGLYCINYTLDKSYKDAYNKILSGNYTSDDVYELKQLDDLQRALKITMYDSIKNITNDKATQEYCETTANALSRSSILWKE